MFRNPLVRICFYLSFSLTVLMNQTVLILGIGVIIFFGLLYLNRNLFPEVLVRITPFFRFFPYMAVLYVGFSILLTTATMSEILIEIGFASLKILLMVSIMALYIEQSYSSGVLIALRSLWSTLNRPWKWVEDFFLFFELTFRFFPAFQKEWESIHKGKSALGLNANTTRWTQIQNVGHDLPGIILRNYRKAEETAKMMKLRGYGNQIPRGVAFPIRFYLSDGLFIIGIICCFFGVNFLGKI